MAYNYSKLKGKIIEVFGSYKVFAEAIGMTPESVGKKLKPSGKWTNVQMLKVSNALNFPECEIPDYFFVEKVQ